MQSIDDLRLDIENLETPYQNELKSIDAQIEKLQQTKEGLEKQIKELQQTIEGLKEQRSDATARYVQEKGRMEAEIDRLKSEIMALFN